MSLVLYGGGVTDNRGSIGGNTFSRSRFGATIRAKTSPVNIINAHTSQRRTTLQTVSGLWSQLLTEPERQAWNAFALLNPVTNVFGQISYLSGMQWFTKCAINQQNFPVSISTTPPLTGTYTGISSMSVTATNGLPGSINVTIVNPALAGTPTTQVWVTNNLSPGVSYVNSALRFVDYIASPSGTTDVATDWHIRFGGVPLLQGRKIFVLCYNMNLDDGTTSAGVFASCIIT